MSRGVLAFGVCLALVLGGCGGSDDSTTSSTTNASETTPTTADAPQSSQSTTAQGEKETKQTKGTSKNSTAKQGNNEDSGPSSSSPKKHLNLVKVPPISSAPKAGSKHPAPGVKTVKGGDNSVQEYGVESGESERTEAAIALQAYLNARAEEDWGTACSLLAKKPMEQLERIQRAATKQGQHLNGCAQTMALLREGEAQSLQQAQITEVLSFRGGGDIEGDPSYLIFTGPPGNTLFSMPMYSEGGAWKAGLARPSELPV